MGKKKCGPEGRPVDDKPQFFVIVDPELVSFGELVRLYKALDDLYFELCGDHLQVVQSDSYMGEKTVSKFDQHEGTEWNGGETSLKAVPTTPYIERSIVHEAITKLLDQADVVLSQMEQRFPCEMWGDKYPAQSALQVVLDALIAEDEKKR